MRLLVNFSGNLVFHWLFNYFCFFNFLIFTESSFRIDVNVFPRLLFSIYSTSSSPYRTLEAKWNLSKALSLRAGPAEPQHWAKLSWGSRVREIKRASPCTVLRLFRTDSLNLDPVLLSRGRFYYPSHPPPPPPPQRMPVLKIFTQLDVDHFGVCFCF